MTFASGSASASVTSQRRLAPRRGQALEEAEEVKKARGEDFKIWWQLGFARVFHRASNWSKLVELTCKKWYKIIRWHKWFSLFRLRWCSILKPHSNSNFTLCTVGRLCWSHPLCCVNFRKNSQAVGLVGTLPVFCWQLSASCFLHAVLLVVGCAPRGWEWKDPKWLDSNWGTNCLLSKSRAVPCHLCLIWCQPQGLAMLKRPTAERDGVAAWQKQKNYRNHVALAQR